MGKTGCKNQNYSYEFKINAVETYLSGKYGGMGNTAKALGLSSKTQLFNRVKLHRENLSFLRLMEDI